MAFYTQPIITDTKILALISEVRKEKGVHAYLDVPHNQGQKAWDIQTTISDLMKAASSTLKYTVLVRVLADDFGFALGLHDVKKNVALEIGKSANSAPYGSIYENSDWKQLNFDKNFDIKAGNFMVCTMILNASNGETSYEFNGEAAQAKRTFSDKSLLKYAVESIYYHPNIFKNVAVMEHHFLYKEITAALPRVENRITIYVDNKAQVASMSAGGWAVIIGSYLEVDAQHNGILVGFWMTKQNVHVFAKGNHVIFRISVTDLGVLVATKDDSVYLKGERPGNEYIDIILQNIAIDNMEFHSGRKAR